MAKLSFKEMILVELLDSSATIGSSEITKDSDREFEIVREIDGYKTVFYASEFKGGWDIEFSELFEDGDLQTPQYNMTNRGNAPKVLSFVLAAMKKMVDIKNPSKIYFSANKADRSRAAVYERMIKKHFNDWTYKKDDENDKSIYFTIEKK